MALPLSGTITASMINTELGRAANAPFNMNDSAVRSLAGKPSGAIAFSDFYGKSNGWTVTVGTGVSGVYTFYGFNKSAGYGSISGGDREIINLRGQYRRSVDLDNSVSCHFADKKPLDGVNTANIILTAVASNGASVEVEMRFNSGYGSLAGSNNAAFINLLISNLNKVVNITMRYK